MKKIGILTNIDANHGSCVFNVSLSNIFQKVVPDSDIKFLNYLTPSWYLYEILRALKPYRKIPTYNLQRYLNLSKFSRENLSITPFFSLLPNQYHHLVSVLKKYDFNAVVVGKVVWDIAKIWQTPQFPNIFWLSNEIPALKIAYAVSGHRTDKDRFRENIDEVRQILASYELIGVRDDITLELLDEAGVTKLTDVQKVSDPAFHFDCPNIDLDALISKYRIDPNRPILGMLFFGKPELSLQIRDYYHQKGYQIINFNMYNPYVDLNIGHQVDPFEWARLFKLLKFCITDRFHGSVFCIRNQVPFVAIEPYEPRSLSHSKVFDLVKSFNLTECYQSPFASDFSIEKFLEVCQQIQADWESIYLPRIAKQLEDQVQQDNVFIQKLQRLFDTSVQFPF